MRNTAKQPPVFIVGAPRSGTTLLRNCLNAHPRIYILPETHYFFRFYGTRNLPGRGFAGKERNSLVARLFRSSPDPDVAKFQTKEPELVREIERQNRKSNNYYKQLFNKLLELFCERDEGDIAGEKSPTHFLFIRLMHRWYPKAFIYFMERDAKRVAASYLHNKPRDTYTTRKRALRTIVSQWILARLYRNRYSNICTTISYQRLTREPRKVLTEISSQLGIDFDERMLVPGVNNSSYGSNPGYTVDPDIGIVPQDPDKWKYVLSTREAEMIKRSVRGEGGSIFVRSFLYRELWRLKWSRQLSLWGINFLE